MTTEEKNKEVIKDGIVEENKPKKRGRPKKTDTQTSETNTAKKKTTTSKTTKSSAKSSTKSTTATKTTPAKKKVSSPKKFDIEEVENDKKEEVKEVEKVKPKVDDNTVFKIDELNTKKAEIETSKTELSEKEKIRREIEAKFATQRVASIREELDRTNLKELEFERQKEAWKQEIYEKEQALIRKYESRMAAEEENQDNEDAKEEIVNENRKDKKKDKKKKKHGLFFRIFRFFFILGILGAMVVAFLLYNPWWSDFRDWYITTAMTTMNHQWLATMLYPQSVIDDVMARNTIIQIDDVTDLSKISTTKQEEKVVYANEFERQVLEKDPNNPDYKLIDIEGDGYNGYLAVIYDASKVHTMVTNKLNVVGQYVKDMAVEQGAVLAINGGGFDDPNYSSNGGSPTGITIVRGEVLTSRNNGGAVGGLVGFTEDNILTLGRIGVSQAEEMGIRDAVTTSCPFLIINGNASEVVGNRGWGAAARTVIGQRQDGIVLMLVLNGRNFATGIVGADMDDLIEIMERYGAYNAACLDGGTSSVIVENGEVLNDPIDGRGRHQTRYVPTAFGLFLDEDEQ